MSSEASRPEGGRLCGISQQPSDNAPVVSLRGVARTFSGASPVYALRNATFDVSKGEQVALVGRSGSGKSTLLNVLGLLDNATSGTYLFGGKDVARLQRNKQTELRSTSVGFVFQQAFLLPYLTAQENVELPLRRRRLDKAQRRRRAVEALGAVQLEHRRRALPSTLSGGEAQRVALARALAQEPSLLLCDEPTGNLDERTSATVAELIRAQSADGVAVVVVTHDLALARTFPRVLSVRDGSVMEGLDPRLLADRSESTQ